MDRIMVALHNALEDTGNGGRKIKDVYREGGYHPQTIIDYKSNGVNRKPAQVVGSKSQPRLLGQLGDKPDDLEFPEDFDERSIVMDEIVDGDAQTGNSVP